MKKAKTKLKAQSRSKAESKKKATTKKAAKKSTQKKKQVNPVEVRQDIANIVGSQAKKITKRVVDEAVTGGQLATVKYLFEMAGFYPPAPEANTERPEEDTLAQRLVRRLGLEEGPVPSNEEDEPPMRIVIPIAKAARVGVEAMKLAGGSPEGEDNLLNREKLGGQKCPPHSCPPDKTPPHTRVAEETIP